MALELETDILLRVGLGRHFNWSNGSGSCGAVRRSAIDKLPVAIQESHTADPSAIAPPYAPLIEVYKDAAQVGDMYTLTTAWQVASDVIRVHMDVAHLTDEAERIARMDKAVEWLRDHYNLHRPDPTHSRLWDAIRNDDTDMARRFMKRYRKQWGD
jgi:hypothetical protein